MENIYTCSKPFYIFSKVLGLFPMSFDGPASKGFLKRTWHDILTSSCSLSVLVALIALQLIYGKLFQPGAPIFFKVWQLSIISCLFMLFIQFFVQIHKRNRIQEFFGLLHKFDSEVKSSFTEDFAVIADFKLLFILGKAVRNCCRL